MSIRGVSRSSSARSRTARRRLVERVWRRQLEAITDEPDAVAGVDRGLQAPERVLLVGLELTQALLGVQRAAERHGELVAIGVPALGGHQEPGGVGVAAPDGAIQAPGPQRVASDEPQPQLIAGALHAAVVVEHPRAPRLRQQLDRLVDEPSARRSHPLQRGEQLVVGARRAAQRDRVQDGVHRRAQVAVAAADLVELLLVDRRQLTGLDRGRGVQPLEADLAADAVQRQLAGRGALEQDHRELPAERGELVALAGGLAALLVDAAPRAPIAEAQQLVELVQQLVAALDHERLQQHEHQRVAARGLQTPQLLGGHPAPERLQRAAPRRRQRAHVDLRRRRARRAGGTAAPGRAAP